MTEPEIKVDHAFKLIEEEKDSQTDRSQVVINKESGRQLEIQAGVPFEELYQQTTDAVVDVLKDHDVVCVAGMSGIGKSELFLGHYAWIKDQKKQGKEVKRGSLVECFDQKGITHIVVDAPSVNYYIKEGSKGRDRLDAAQMILVDESLTFIKNDDQESLRALLAYAKENGKKIVLVGGGPLDASQQNTFLNQLLADVDEPTEKSQFVEMSPSLLTESQAKDFLRVKGFTQDWVTNILAKLDTLHVPLIMRVLLKIVPPNPGQEMSWEEYSTIHFDKISLRNITNHVELQSDLGEVHTDGPESTFQKETVQADTRVQTVLNRESGRELVAEPTADIRELYAQVTDKVFNALRDHDFCFLGGTSGLGKSELFLEQTFGFDKLGTRFGSIISKLDASTIPSFIIEEASFTSDLLDSLEEDLADGDEDAQKLSEASILFVDESLAFTKNDDFDSLHRLLDFAKERKQKIVFIGGGPLDSNQQVDEFKRLLLSNGESFDDAQGVEFTPSILTAQQSIDMLIIKGFTPEQAVEVVNTLDAQEVPLTMRVVFQTIQPPQNGNWSDYVATLTKKYFFFQTEHLEFKGHLE